MDSLFGAWVCAQAAKCPRLPKTLFYVRTLLFELFCDFPQIVEGAVGNVAGAVKQLMVGAKVLRAKKTFLTTLESFRGNFHANGGDRTTTT